MSFQCPAPVASLFIVQLTGWYSCQVEVQDDHGQWSGLTAGVVSINGDGTYDVYLQMVHQRVRNVPRDQLRVLTDEYDGFGEDDDVDDADREVTAPADDDVRTLVFGVFVTSCLRLDCILMHRPGFLDENLSSGCC